jgi:hypothetical protein
MGKGVTPFSQYSPLFKFYHEQNSYETKKKARRKEKERMNGEFGRKSHQKRKRAEISFLSPKI